MIVERGLGEEARIARCEFVLFPINTFDIYFVKFTQLKIVTDAETTRGFKQISLRSNKSSSTFARRMGGFKRLKRKAVMTKSTIFDENVAGVVREGGGAKSCCQEGGELRERGPS